MQATTILLVDDDREIRSLLSTYLEYEGFAVSTAANANEMFECLKSGLPSIVVLDVMMPGRDGISALREIRTNPSLSHLPVLLLTALAEPLERSQGLEQGADDYLGKPFVPRELLARIKAILRRTVDVHRKPTAARGTLEQVQQITRAVERRFFAEFVLDMSRCQVFDATGLEIKLTTGEYRLLVAFTGRPQRVLSRDALLVLTQNDTGEVFDRSVDVLVSRLRSKFGDTARAPRLFRTVRSGGYMFLESVRTELASENAPTQIGA